jgi:protein involved in polysaccharide export with SLBB domain
MTGMFNSLRNRRWLLTLLGVWLCCAAAIRMQAQLPEDPPTPPPSSQLTAIGDLGQSPNSSLATFRSSVSPAQTNSNGQYSTTEEIGAPISLTSDQIFDLLRQEPDLNLEFKALLSEMPQATGAQLQADTITDETLYSRIASSPEFRANITTFLRARGYSTDSIIQSDPSILLPDDALSTQRTSQMRGRESTQDRESLSGVNSMQRSNSAADPIYRTSRSPANQRVDTSEQNQSGNVPPNITADPQVIHRPTPQNLLSLRDLYTQLPDDRGKLKRFGSDMFLRRDGLATGQGAPHEAPPDIPVGPDYIVGPDDSLSIDLWGGIAQNFTRTIDREGRIALPESGTVQVAGLSLERVQGVIASALEHQYRGVQVAVTVAHLRSMRVYVVGDVQRPGAYEVSSLATSLNALYAAGGPTNIGSLRLLRHYRGMQLIGELDMYDFLLHGVQREDRLQAGDTILVPPSGPQVAVYGAVKRPAIYELKSGESKSSSTLASVLDDAGGATVAAELNHIEIDRIDANQQRETVSLDLPPASSPESARAAIATFRIQDGDRIRISPLLPYSLRVVYLQGHVVRPGRVSFHDGMRLSDLVHSARDLLPEPADKAELIRLMPPDLHPETSQFSLPDVLLGNENITLQPFDTIRIYGRYEADPPRVTVGGEVLRPGTYALSAGMTAAQLVRMAGGFRRGALLEDADLTSYQVASQSNVVSQRTSVRIGDAVIRHDSSADVALKAGDILTIHQLEGWSDIGASITIEGEVAHPGNYGIQRGERLSSILRRAGGLRETSYPMGAVLVREEVRRLEEKSRAELIRQIETSSTAARMRPSLGGDQAATMQAISQQQEEVLDRLKSQPAIGRLVIQINTDIASWENTPADIEVRAGDVLRIPKRPGFVLVTGQVFNSSAITFAPDKTAGWYLKHAGGPTEIANTKEIFIIRANGSVVGRGSGSRLNHDVLSTRLDPGDVVVVPQKIIGASVFWRNLLTVAQLSSSIAITAAVAGLI